MRGRQLFELFFPILHLIGNILYVLPVFIIRWLWIISDLFPNLLGIGFRYILALRLSKKIGKNIFFGRGVEIKDWDKLEIGNNVSIHKDCYIDAQGGIKIGNDVSIAHASSLLSFDHSWEDKTIPIRSNKLILKPIEIYDDVWIGCGCRVLGGTIIESRVIVAAGAVVVNNINNNSLVGGIPAKLIKEI